MERRKFLKLGTLFLISSSLYLPAFAVEMVSFKDMKRKAEVDVVYHADFPQEKRFKTMLRNITNHLSVYDFNPLKIHIVVVAHGAGAKFFLKDLKGTKWEKEPIDQKAIKAKLEELLQYGVEFYICGITVKRLKLREKLYDFVKIVPSGVGTVAHLQNIGYAYIKVQ